MTSEGRKPDIGCWFLGAWLISLRTGEGLHRRTACLPGKCSRHLVAQPGRFEGSDIRPSGLGVS